MQFKDIMLRTRRALSLYKSMAIAPFWLSTDIMSAELQQCQPGSHPPVRQAAYSLDIDIFLLQVKWGLVDHHALGLWPSALWTESSNYSIIIPIYKIVLIWIYASVSTLKEISRIPGNPDSFRVIFGKCNNSRKFREIQENGKSYVKTCRKTLFYSLKSKMFCSLA